MSATRLISTLALGALGTAQGKGGCPALPMTPYTDELSPFGWPLTPNDWNFADLGAWPEKYLFCGGQRQSPIDITRNSISCGVADMGADGVLQSAANYKAADMHPKVKVSSYMRTAYAAGDFGTLTLKDPAGNNLEYEAVQVHVTSPSLHSVDGEFYDAEMTIFHKPKGHPNMLKDGLAVSVLFKESDGQESTLFSQMGFTMDDHAMETEGSWDAPHYIDLPGAVEHALQGAAYQYNGSVPVPPCSETIKYIVLDQVQNVSSLQTKKLQEALSCYAGGVAKRGPRPNPFLRTCREIVKNSLQVGGSYEAATCYKAELNGTQDLSATCWYAAEGQEHCLKSPIDVVSSMAGEGSAGAPVFNFKTVSHVEVSPSDYTLDAVAQDHGMEAPIGNFGSIIAGGRNFLLRKISVKAISSHTYGGVHHAGEIQVEGIMYGDEVGGADVSHSMAGHSTDEGHGTGHRRLADDDHHHRVVLSIPVKLGAESELLRQLGLPFEAYRGAIKDKHSYKIDHAVDLKAGLAKALGGPWLWYSGGLTGPGCPAWGVRWLLFETPLEASLAQLNFLALHVSGPDSTRVHGVEMDAVAYENRVTSMSLPKTAVDAHSSCDAAKPWDYKDATCWSENFPTCADGHMQSPIDIRTSEVAKTGKDNFLHKCDWRPVSGLHVVNTGYGLTVANDQFGYITLIGEDGFPEFFQAAQLQLHMPSEHLMNGRQFAAELQIVHRRQKVVSQLPNSLDSFPLVTASFLFDIGDDESNLLKQFFLSETQIQEGTYLTAKHPIDLMRSLGPAIDGDYYTYEGSFTKPDCHEQNKWFIFEHVFSMSLDQWSTFKAMFPSGNNRPVQPVHGRAIAKNSFEDYEPVHYEFFLGRHTGRNRFKPGEYWILFPALGSLTVMTIAMLATFVRENMRKQEGAGGLAETIGRGQYNRM